MASVGDVARAALAAVNADAGYLLACRWTTERYRALCSRARFRHLRQIGMVVVPAPITSGLATVTRGAKTITFDATGQAAISSRQIGWWIRLASVWYEITNVEGGVVSIKVEYAEDDVTAGAYRIVQRYTPLDPSVRWIGRNLVHGRTRIPLVYKSLAELDMIYPGRILVGSLPGYWTEAKSILDANGQAVKALEIYPFPTTSEAYYYVYWQIPNELKMDDQIPPEIDAEVLKEGVLIDIMRHNASKAIQMGQIEAGAYWRNEYRSQSTTWEKYIIDAIRTDRGVDDLTMILDAIGGPAIVGDISTARGEIFSRGARP